MEAARINAKENNVIAEFMLPNELNEEKFNVVVANILANPLKMLAGVLTSHVAPQGSLVLSGILAQQADDIIAVYREVAPEIKLSVYSSENGWVCIAGRRA